MVAHFLQHLHFRKKTHATYAVWEYTRRLLAKGNFNIAIIFENLK